MPLKSMDGTSTPRQLPFNNRLSNTTSTWFMPNSMNSITARSTPQGLGKGFAHSADSLKIDCEYMAPIEEYSRREFAVPTRHCNIIGHTVGLVFLTSSMPATFPYPVGNTNVSIEQVVGVIGPKWISRGGPGGRLRCRTTRRPCRSDTVQDKVELLQLADEKYPIRAERLDDVIKAAAGQDVDHIAALTPRQVIPPASLSTCVKHPWKGRCGRRLRVTTIA